MDGNGQGTVEDRVIRLVIDKLCADKDPIPTVNRDTSFTNDLAADSLDTVELVMELEQEFDLDIPDDIQENITTVGAAVDFIEKSIEESSA